MLLIAHASCGERPVSETCTGAINIMRRDRHIVSRLSCPYRGNDNHGGEGVAHPGKIDWRAAGDEPPRQRITAS